MALTQTRYPSTSSATSQWSSLSNVRGNTPSTFTQDALSKNGQSAPLTVRNYGFSIPSNATITNISFGILKGNASNTTPGNESVDSVINIYVGTQRISPNMADTVTKWALPGPVEATYSDSAAAWGGLTPAQANDSNFGLYLIADNPSFTIVNAQVYTISCTITYTLPEFFMKVWNGSAWVTGSLRRWNGSAWETGLVDQVKIWNGSAWVPP